MKQQITGTVGAIFTALCCIGTPALLAFLASIGVGFLINDLILMPFLVVFLGSASGGRSARWLSMGNADLSSWL